MKKRDEKGNKKADTSTLMEYVLYSAQHRERWRWERADCDAESDRLWDKQMEERLNCGLKIVILIIIHVLRFKVSIEIYILANNASLFFLVKEAAVWLIPWEFDCPSLWSSWFSIGRISVFCTSSKSAALIFFYPLRDPFHNSMPFLKHINKLKCGHMTSTLQTLTSPPVFSPHSFCRLT